jgi:hypothetical protein
MAAWLCRRHTVASLSEIAAALGRSRADSVPGLIRPLETRLKTTAHLLRDLDAIERCLVKQMTAPIAAQRRSGARGKGRKTSSRSANGSSASGSR